MASGSQDEVGETGNHGEKFKVKVPTKVFLAHGKLDKPESIKFLARLLSNSMVSCPRSHPFLAKLAGDLGIIYLHVSEVLLQRRLNIRRS